MQLVSREILFDIMSHKRDVHFKDASKIDEGDSQIESAFQTFLKKASTSYNKANSEYDNHEVAMSVFSDAMWWFMKDNEDSIRFVGDGSSRTCYALANGTAFKLAKTDAGIAQNKQEAKLCMNPSFKYAIFPDFYDADRKDWLALNCELCAKATMVDFARLFQTMPKLVVSAIEFIIQTKLEDWELDKAYKHFEANHSYAIANFVHQLIENKTEATKAMRSLLDFYRKYGLNELLTGDLESVANWGITIRNNQKVLVVIDAGFNDDIYQKYYVIPDNKKNNSMS